MLEKEPETNNSQESRNEVDSPDLDPETAGAFTWSSENGTTEIEPKDPNFYGGQKDVDVIEKINYQVIPKSSLAVRLEKKISELSSLVVMDSYFLRKYEEAREKLEEIKKRIEKVGRIERKKLIVENKKLNFMINDILFHDLPRKEKEWEALIKELSNILEAINQIREKDID